MGTNFYYKIPLKKREIQEFKDAITEDPDFDKLESLIAFYSPRKIHLGKRSAGWQFLWDYHQGKYYEASLKSIREFLETKGGYIVNEYGEKFSTDQFFKEIEDWLYLDQSHYNLVTYYEANSEIPYKVNPAKHEFESDGLRFSKDSDFS